MFFPRKFVILYNLPLEKDWFLHLNKIESPLPEDALCIMIGWNWPSVRGEEDNDGERTFCDQKSSLELSAQVFNQSPYKLIIAIGVKCQGYNGIMNERDTSFELSWWYSIVPKMRTKQESTDRLMQTEQFLYTAWTSFAGGMIFIFTSRLIWSLPSIRTPASGLMNLQRVYPSFLPWSSLL